MNFSKFDAIVLLSMSLAVIVMSFVFPALGLANDTQANGSDVPELSIETDRFDLAGDFPERATTPNSGELEYNSSRSPSFSDNVVWLEGTGTDGGVELVTIVNQSANATQVTLRSYNDDTTIANEDVIRSKDLGSLHELNIDDKNGDPYTVTLQLVALDYLGSGDYDYRYTFNVRERPGSNDGFAGNLPVVGTILDGGDELASILSWIGSVIWFYLVSLYEIALNIVGVLFDVTSFGFELLAFLVQTYSAVISGAEGWATAFVAIPGIILSLEFFKLGAIAVSLLPTT